MCVLRYHTFVIFAAEKFLITSQERYCDSGDA